MSVLQAAPPPGALLGSWVLLKPGNHVENYDLGSRLTVKSKDDSFAVNTMTTDPPLRERGVEGFSDNPDSHTTLPPQKQTKKKKNGNSLERSSKHLRRTHEKFNRDARG